MDQLDNATNPVRDESEGAFVFITIWSNCANLEYYRAYYDKLKEEIAANGLDGLRNFVEHGLPMSLSDNTKLCKTFKEFEESPKDLPDVVLVTNDEYDNSNHDRVLDPQGTGYQLTAVISSAWQRNLAVHIRSDDSCSWTKHVGYTKEPVDNDDMTHIMKHRHILLYKHSTILRVSADGDKNRTPMCFTEIALPRTLIVRYTVVTSIKLLHHVLICKSVWRRLIWLTLAVSSFAVAGYFTEYFLEDFARKPVVMDQLTEPENYKFPSLTICCKENFTYRVLRIYSHVNQASTKLVGHANANSTCSTINLHNRDFSARHTYGITLIVEGTPGEAISGAVTLHAQGIVPAQKLTDRTTQNLETLALAFNGGETVWATFDHEIHRMSASFSDHCTSNVPDGLSYNDGTTTGYSQEVCLDLRTSAHIVSTKECYPALYRIDASLEKPMNMCAPDKYNDIALHHNGSKCPHLCTYSRYTLFEYWSGSEASIAINASHIELRARSVAATVHEQRVARGALQLACYVGNFVYFFTGLSIAALLEFFVAFVPFL